MRKSKSKAKAEIETVERARVSEEAKAKEKAYISRIASEAIENLEVKARLRVKSNTIQREAAEAAANIRSISED